MRVLVVEDEIRMAALLKRALTEEGHAARKTRRLAHRHRCRDLAELRSFANGIHRDQQAVTNGLTCPAAWPAVEGNVTKMLKRQLHGRASFTLLRKRVILQPG
jgi:transposase